MLLSLLVVGPLAALGFAAMPGQHASPGHSSSDHDHPVGDYIGCICGYGPLYISSDGALFHSDPAPVDLQVGDSVKYTAGWYTAKVISIESGSLTGIEEGVTWYYIEYVDENGSTVSRPATLDLLSSVPAGGSPMCHRFFEANYYMPSDGQMGSASNSYACPAGVADYGEGEGQHASSDGCEGQGGAC